MCCWHSMCRSKQQAAQLAAGLIRVATAAGRQQRLAPEPEATVVHDQMTRKVSLAAVGMVHVWPPMYMLNLIAQHVGGMRSSRC